VFLARSPQVQHHFPVSLGDWLAGFKDLHDQVRRRQLPAAGLPAYRAARDELARALLAAHRLALRDGESPRRALRVNRALPVDLDLPGGRVRAPTLDLSTGGFGAALPHAPPVGASVPYTLRLEGGDVSGMARLLDARPRAPGPLRASFAFEALSDDEVERIELAVFDAVLEQLAP
jgi:PilZ domain